MRIVVVGAGKVGRVLTEQLAAEKHDIVVIDQDTDLIESLVNIYDVRGVVGNGGCYDVQKDAFEDGADLLIATTSSDETNILACLVAKKLGTPHTIARIRNPEYEKQLHFMREELGLSMVVLGLYGAWLGHVNLSLLCAGPYLAYAAHASGVAQSVRRMQRTQDAARKLAEGRMMPVGAYACAGPPSRLTLARMAGRLSDLRYHLLLVVDPDTGRISESLTEGELTQRLFHMREESQGR